MAYMIPLYRWTIGTGSSFSTATKCTVPLTMPSGAIAVLRGAVHGVIHRTLDSQELH